ncbi:PrsW family intramembrane metalloprotease [Myxococcota bacterium]|nr:PrsW family intramembrane metalloprotease [Myxococcota bacterium]MBU1535320.1 PrsW family intramembrane metalloprotease [Myxococcota bacterium]
MHLVTVAVTILPCLLIFLYIYTHDQHPEPKGLIAKVAIFGALSAIPVLLVVGLIKGLGVPSDPLMRSIYVAFVFAAIPEEFFKMMMVYQVAYKRPEFDEPIDGVIYGAASSLGFAMLENVLYVSQYGLETGIFRAFTAIPMHLFCGVTMGYFIGRAKFVRQGQSSVGFWIMALLIPILIHGIYDASIFYYMESLEYPLLVPGVIALVLVVGMGIVLMNSLEKANLGILSSHYGIPEDELQKHLPKGTMTESKLPQILVFFKEASAAGGVWAVPTDFQQQIIEKFGEPAPDAPTLGKRGFLGFLFSFFGVMVAGLGVLMFLVAFMGISGELKKPVPTAVSWATVGVGVFILLNGILLYFKGFYRNRKLSASRGWGAQVLMFLSATVASVGGLAGIAYLEEPAKGDAKITFITAGVAAGIWLLVLIWPKKR